MPLSLNSGIAGQAVGVGILQTGAVGFNPRSIPTLLTWYDVSQMAGLSNGSTTNTITDFSGNAYHQVDASAVETYNTNSWNGMPGITPHISNNALASSKTLDLSSYSGVTIYTVAKNTGTGATSDLYSHTANAANVLRQFYFATQSGVSIAGSTYTSQNAILRNKATIFSDVYTTTTARQWVNGYASGSAVSRAAITFANAAHYLGNAGPGQGNRFTGVIYEQLIYAGAHTTAQRLQVEAYLQNKWKVEPPVFNAAKTYINIVGDSLSAGQTAAFGSGYVDQMIPLLSYVPDYNDLAVSGDNVASMKTYNVSRLQACYQAGRPKNICVVWAGTNDLGSSTAAAVYADIVSMCTTARNMGYLVCVAPIIPKGNGSGSQIAGFDTKRATLNTNIATNWATFADGYANLVGNAAFDADTDFTNTTYYFTDNVHLTATGYGVVAGIVAPVLNAAPFV